MLKLPLVSTVELSRLRDEVIIRPLSLEKNLEDIFELLNCAEAQEILLPQFICVSYLDMPSNDLSSISSMNLSLKD